MSTEPPLDANTTRFILELEFVQSLANPQYLEFLSQHVQFTPHLLNYLRYLKYWQTLPYVQFITYPYCLEVLDLLQDKSFRDGIVGNTSIHSKQYVHWKEYSAKKHHEDAAVFDHPDTVMNEANEEQS